MTLTPQHRQILNLHQNHEWVCSTAIEFIRDQRKRISELNHMGYTFEAKPCDGRCGKKHNSRLYMRRLKPTESQIVHDFQEEYTKRLSVPKQQLMSF